MFSEAGHPNISLPDWRAFQSDVSKLHLAEVIDRDKIGLPDVVLPLARGVAVPSDALLKKAGHRAGRRRPYGWCPNGHHEFTAPWIFAGTTFAVRRGGVGWFMLRRPGNGEEEILAFRFGSTPLMTREYQSAMRLLTLILWFYQPCAFQWVQAVPDDCNAAIAFALQRCVNETSPLP